MLYSHEIDALNALVAAVERNNDLLEQLLAKENPQRKVKPNDHK